MKSAVSNDFHNLGGTDAVNDGVYNLTTIESACATGVSLGTLTLSGLGNCSASDKVVRTNASSQLVCGTVTTGIGDGYIGNTQDHTAGGNLKFNNNDSIYFEHSSLGGFIPYPGGGQYTVNSPSITGAIKISMPVHGVADMISFHVDIFDYTTNESFSAFIAGYLYQTTGNNEWVNETVIIHANDTSRDFTVRFGADGIKNCVWIGEIDSTWAYPQVTVRDVQVGYSADVDAWNDGWAISFETSFDTIDATHSGNLPASKYALNADLLDGLTSARFSKFNTDTYDSGSCGEGWVTVASSSGSRGFAEVYVWDVESSDHSFMHINWMRSYADSAITVVNSGGHAKRITGARVIKTSDDTSGEKRLQVYVTTTSDYMVRIKDSGALDGFTSISAYTPTLQNLPSGWSVDNGEITGLDSEGGHIATTGKIKVDGYTVYHAGNDPFDTAGEIQNVAVGGEVSGTVGSITLDCSDVISTGMRCDGENLNVYSLSASDGSPDHAVYVDAVGNVGIGMTDPGAYKLNVASATGGNPVLIGDSLTVGGEIACENLDVTADATIAGDLYMTGDKVYGGWNVPIDIKGTTVTHNGNFGGFDGMYNWIQSNGCEGYHVCSSEELTSYMQINGNSFCAPALNWYISSISINNTYLDQNCEGWTSSADLSYIRGAVFNSFSAGAQVGPCNQQYGVWCCK